MSHYDSDELDSMAHCPCGAVHPPSYQLSTCDHKGCGRRGCHGCLRPCEVSSACGHFCAEHRNEIEISGLKKPLLACLRCEAEDLDEVEVAKERIAA